VGMVPNKVYRAMYKTLSTAFELVRSSGIGTHAWRLLCFVVDRLNIAAKLSMCSANASSKRSGAGRWDQDNNKKVATMLKCWNRRSKSMPVVPVLSSAPNADEFLHEYVMQNSPVVARDGLWQPGWHRNVSAPDRSTYPAFSTAHLKDAFGDAFVRVSISETDRFDGPESGRLWGLDHGVDVLVRPPLTSMRLRDFFSLVESNVPETFYVEYLALHQYIGDSFLQLIPLPDSAASPQLEALVTNLWIGTKPTTSPLHYDDYENLLCQIRGRKEIVLYPPADLTNLYYIGRSKGKMTYDYPSKFTRDPGTIEKESYVFGSSVNLDSPDWKRFPLYRNAKPMRVVLEPGDVIYLPAYWHHEVQSLPDEDGLNVAVNFWFKNMTLPINDMELLSMR